MASVIIPAHNEEAVLARTLDALLAGLAPNEFEIIVVCNGCTDRSVEIARGYEPRVQVIALDQPSKIGALNAGDAAATGFPRVYLDADIEMSSDSLRRVVQNLEQPGALSAEPEPMLDTTCSSPAVRGWYLVWQDLYRGIPGKIGSGVLGLSAEGRARFASFPDVTADDAYVRANFAPHELTYVEGASCCVTAPRTLRNLVKIKTRSRLGSAELATQFPELWAKHEAARPAARGLTGLSVRLWPLAPWYVAVTLLVRLRAQRQSQQGYVGWERDDSSRS